MIKTLSVNTEIMSDKEDYSYIKSLPLFQDNNFEFNFEPGLNVIMCENGAGKSTLLSMLAKSTFSKKYGFSNIDKDIMISHDFLRSITKEDIEQKKVSCHSSVLSYQRFFSVKKDDSMTFYCNPKFIVGSNEDTTNTYKHELFSLQQYERIHLKGSTGKKNRSRMETINKIIDGEMEISKKFKPNIDQYIEKSRFRSYYSKDVNAEYLASNIESGQITILIDEPESGLDLKSKILWFSTLEEKIKNQNLQVIMITHDEMALKFKNVNFVETKNYTENCRKIMAEYK